METVLSLQTGLSADPEYWKKSENSIISNATFSPNNHVFFSDTGRVLLAIVTLGVSCIVIKIIEDYKQCKAQAEVLSISLALLNSIDCLDGSNNNEKVIRIPLSNGNEVVFTERRNTSGYCTVIEEKKPRWMHMSSYTEDKTYINKSLKEIQKTLIQDIISHQEHYSYKEGALIEMANYLKSKMDDAVNSRRINNIIKANEITHPILYDEKNIGVKLRECHVPGDITLMFLSKSNNILSSREHIVLGVVTPSGDEFVLSASSGDGRNIYSDKNVRYIKLGLTSGNTIEDVFSKLVSTLKDSDPTRPDFSFSKIVSELYPNANVPTLPHVE